MGSHDSRLSLVDRGMSLRSTRIRLVRTHLVCSGVVVAGLCQPSRFVMRWTERKEERKTRGSEREKEGEEPRESLTVNVYSYPNL